MAVLLVSATSLVAIALWGISQRVSDNAVDISTGNDAPPPPEIGELEGAFNVLLVGADNAAVQGDRYGERDGTLNDVNIVLHVSADHTTGVALSLPRDLVIAHPECTGPDGTTFPAMSAQPINAALERGGLGCVADTVRALTDLPIDYAALVTFDGVIEMTEAIGGVEVCLDAPLRDPRVASPTTGEILDLPAGKYPISGDDALGFLRSRYGVGDGGDLGRISSQQQFLASMARKIKSDETLTNIPRLFALANVATDSDYMQLDTRLAHVNTIISMALTLRTVDTNNLVFVQYPVTDDPSNPNKVVPLQAKADELLALIRSDQPFQLGANSQGAGVADPTAPEPQSTTPPPPANSSDPSAAPEPPVLDDVPGQTAQQETCTAVND